MQKKFSPRQQAKLASRAVGRQARREDWDEGDMEDFTQRREFTRQDRW